MHVDGEVGGCYTLRQFAKGEFMGYYKLWPICRHKQLNECINIDDMPQAYGRNIRPPQAIGPPLHLPSPPALRRAYCICIQRWAGDDCKSFFFSLHQFIIWVTRWGHVIQLLPQRNGIFSPESHRMDFLDSTVLASCSSSLVWHAIALAEAQHASPHKNIFHNHSHLAGAKITSSYSCLG